MLIGLEGYQASVWDVYSESVKPGERIRGDGGYNFYESIVDVLRPRIKDGVKGILIAAPAEKDHQGFMNHVTKHQGWLLGGYSLNTMTFEHILASALNAGQVRDLVKTRGFKEKLAEVTGGDIQRVMNVLESRLNDPEGIEALLFTLEEVEDAVFVDEGSPEYILVTELFRSKNGRRTQRLLQIAANKNIKTVIIKPDTPEGARIAQFGGLVCMLRV
jgi:stalled ribosome rescue protein Dom34